MLHGLTKQREKQTKKAATLSGLSSF